MELYARRFVTDVKPDTTRKAAKPFLILRALLPVLAAFVFTLTLSAQEPVRTFDLPAGAAEQTLKQFAVQAQREIVFSPDSVAGLTTNAVQGEFAPREALDAMLADTGLTATQDAKTGAFAVRKGVRPNGLRAARVENRDRPENSSRVEDGALVLDEYEISGARIDGLNNRGLLQGGADAPLYHDVISRSDIERLGISSLEELFRLVPQTSSVTTALQLPIGNTLISGGLVNSYSTVGLRGFSSAQTVILVNGRAMPRTGLFNGGGADLARIPIAAIERIEILPSAGSAIYGAGALGGAINIILRKEYTGRDLTTYIGTSTEGGATEYRLTYLEGRRFRDGHTNLTLTLSYHHRDALRASQRGYLDEALRRYGPGSTLANAQGQSYFEQYILPAFAAAPGTILVGTGSPIGDLGIPGAAGVRFAAIPSGTTPAQAAQLTPGDFTATAGRANLAPRFGRSILYEPADALSFTAVLDHAFIPDKLDGYAEFTLGRNWRDYTMPQSLAISLSETDPLNPFRTNVTPGFVGRPINLYIDTPDLPDSRVKFDYRSARLVAGLKGTISEHWEWSLDGTLDHSDNTVESDNPISSLTTLTALAPFASPGPSAPAAERRAIYALLADHSVHPISSDVASRYFENIRHSFNRGQQTELNARVLGRVLELPAGPLRSSVAAKRQEWSFDSGQRFSGSDAWSQLINAVPFAPNATESNASRDTRYGVIELAVPVFGKDWRPVPFIHGLELQGSVSREQSLTKGTDSNGVPFVNRQRANSAAVALKLQFTPDFALRASHSEGFYPPNWGDVSLPTTAFSLPGFFPDPKRGNTMQFTPSMDILQGGNSDLSPETAESSNVGLIVTPRALPGFTFNVDFWRTEKTNAIVSQSFVDIIANPDAFGFLITREEPTAAEAAMGWLGRITAVDARAFNASITRTDGADMRIRHRFQYGSLGRFTLTANATFTNRFELLATPTAPIVNTAGGSGPIRWRGYTSATWERDRWSATITGRYTGHRSTLTTDPSPSYPGAYPIDGGRLPAFLRADLQVSYEFPHGHGSGRVLQGTKWTLGVLNATNTKPTFVTNGTGFYDSADDPRQRFVYVQIKKSL